MSRTSKPHDAASDPREIREKAQRRLQLLATLTSDAAASAPPAAAALTNMELLTLAEFMDEIAADMLRADNMEIDAENARIIKRRGWKSISGGAK